MVRWCSHLTLVPRITDCGNIACQWMVHHASRLWFNFEAGWRFMLFPPVQWASRVTIGWHSISPFCLVMKQALSWLESWDTAHCSQVSIFSIFRCSKWVANGCYQSCVVLCCEPGHYYTLELETNTLSEDGSFTVTKKAPTSAVTFKTHLGH